MLQSMSLKLFDQGLFLFDYTVLIRANEQSISSSVSLSGQIDDKYHSRFA